MKRFSLKSLFVITTLIALMLGILLNFHLRSMAQYTELVKVQRGMYEMVPGIINAFLEDEVQIDPDSGLLEFYGRKMDEPRGGSKEWLCHYFDFRYLLSSPLVWINEPTLETENQVARLKGVKQIVIFGAVDQSVLRRWKLRFPNAKILTAEEAGRGPENGPFHFGHLSIPQMSMIG